MTYVPYKGGTLLVPSGPSGMHLFTILTNRCDDGFHLLVSITSIREGIAYDPACVFAGDEHPFTKHPSHVFYRIMEQKRSEALANGVAKGLFIPKEDMPEVPFQNICNGIETSEFIGPWAVEYYRKNGGN